MKYCACLFLFFLTLNLNSQTIGLLANEEGSLKGYTFFSPFSSTKAYMIDHCGLLVNEWDRGTRPGLSAYFLENGLMLRTFKPQTEGPFTSASNAGGLELVDWDNNTVWSYHINTDTSLSHHDAVYMPNGNILVLTWVLVFTDELIEMGRDPNEIAQEGYMWSETILEIEPVGTNEANILWEWKIKDHYVQEFDSTKQNFGVVSEHPELFDINLPELNSNNSNSTRDWNHFNAIDYSPELDQILLSVRNSDEIWILDHSTSTEEAASHSGGMYEQGGDILYRWGNGSAYQRAEVSDQKFFGQHGVNWIKDGLEDEGKIIVFNNGNGRPGPDHTTIEILDPPQVAPGYYTLEENLPFGPTESELVYGNTGDEDFYSAYLSNPQRLSNANTLINAGSPGMIFEIDTNNQVVWRYRIPLSGDNPGTQGGGISNNSTFRAYRYGTGYPGFEGLEINGSAPIEIGGNPLDCEFNTSTILEAKLEKFSVHYQEETHELRVFSESQLAGNLRIYNMNGRLLMNTDLQSSVIKLNFNPIPSIYIAQFILKDGRTYSQKIYISN